MPLKNKHDIKFGSADVLLAINDTGIEQEVSGKPHHPDFRGDVIDGHLTAFLGNKKDKVYFFYDFVKKDRDDVAHELGNADTEESHGTSVTALAAALHGGGVGVTGIAPNVRVLSILGIGNSDTIMMDSLEYIGGLLPNWHKNLYPSSLPFPVPFGQMGNPGPGADIINCSHTQTDQITTDFRTGLQRLTHFGRKRRGVLIFAAAGNFGEDRHRQVKWGAELNVMIVTGSTLNYLDIENSMPSSSYATGIDGVDFCAPSHATLPNKTPDDPFFRGVVTAAFNKESEEDGSNYTFTFGGTSSSTPMVSGIAALMLSANPALTWIEIRHILRETAVPINPKHLGHGRSWKWQDATQNDLVTTHGLLEQMGPDTVTKHTSMAGETEIEVVDATKFSPGQAILIGAGNQACRRCLRRGRTNNRRLGGWIRNERQNLHRQIIPNLYHRKYRPQYQAVYRPECRWLRTRR